MRLQVYLSQAGVASRRGAVPIINSGRIKVNGKVITQPGFAVDELRDVITIDDKKVERERKVYLLLNKPAGYICTKKDPHVLHTVLELLPSHLQDVFPVGRLDKDTRGLLILTNDGDLTYHLTHPRFEVEKTYRVRIRGTLKKEDLSRLTKGGLLIDEFPTSPCEIRIYHQTPRSTSLILTIHEGRKRQIRKMFSQLGYPVMDLMRIAVGTLKIGNLQEGKFRYLSKEEIAALWSDAKMDKGNAPT